VSIYPFPNFAYRSQETGHYAGHSSSFPNNMHTKFMCPSLYHFPNSSDRTEEMGTLVMLATVNLYPTIVLYTLFLWNHILKILKSMAETNISSFNETSLSYKPPLESKTHLISFLLESKPSSKGMTTHIAVIFKCVFALSNPLEI
jgi:hypothetical protein